MRPLGKSVSWKVFRLVVPNSGISFQVKRTKPARTSTCTPPALITLGSRSLKNAMILGGPVRVRATSRAVESLSASPKVMLPSELRNALRYRCPKKRKANGRSTTTVSSSPMSTSGPNS